MRDHGIVNPGMLPALEDNFYPETATIHTITQTQDATGQLVPSLGPAVVGLTDLPCRFVPATMAAGAGGERSGERRMPDETRLVESLVVGFNDYYAAITEEMAVVIDAVTYNIMNVEADGQSETTRLRVERVT